jgi:hypothetical protein
LLNPTPFAAVAIPQTDPSGLEVVVVIVKATFEIRGDRAVLAEQRPVRLSEVPHDPTNPWSSLRYPSDLCTQKRGVDVVVIGEAISPRPVTAMDVAVKVRDATAPLRVHGPRFYFRGVGQVAVGPAAAVERVPLVYEKSYGGMTEDLAVIDERNPSGVGVARSSADLVDRPAPQIEHPAQPHKYASDKHAPMGFGAISSFWSPRRARAGTLDEQWRRDRMPLLPLDFDIRYNNVAHPTLTFEEPLRAGDPVAILGMSEEGLFRFDIPTISPVIHARFDTDNHASVRPDIDTVLIEPSERRIEVVFRKAFPIGRRISVLRELRVDFDGDGPAKSTVARGLGGA